MTRRTHLPIVAAALLLAFAIGPIAAEDLTIVSTVTAPKGAPITATQYLSTDKVRTSDGRFDTIFDVAAGRMVHIDHKKKTYYETTFEEMRAQFAELEEMLQGNPLGKMLGRGGKQVEVSKGSETREVAGYNCEQYLLSLGPKFQFEVWATRELKPNASYYDAKKMAYAAMGPTASRFDKMYEELKEIEGLALATRVDLRSLGMKLDSSSEATEVRKGPIPAGTFDPPAGYKKKKSPYEKKK